MPATPNASAADARPDKLSLVLFSGGFDKVHYALAMAAAALAVNTPVTLFFTMGAARALLAADQDGPGWRRLHPTEDGTPPLSAESELIAKGMGGFEELLSACVMLGAQVMVCEMGMRAMGLEFSQLRPDIEVMPGGLVTFLHDASATGSMLFV